MTKKRKYYSKYGGGEVTAAQYLVELWFEHITKHDLPLGFWKLPKYKGAWGRWAKEINILLQTYRPSTIISALRDPRLKKLRSLSRKAAFIWKPVFDEHEKRIARQESIKISSASGVSQNKATKPYRRKSLLSKLR